MALSTTRQHTLGPLKELGLDSQRVKKLACKLHVMSITLPNLFIPDVPFLAPRKDGAGPFMLFLRGAQLVLQSNFLSVLYLDEVNAALENDETFGSLL